MSSNTAVIALNSEILTVLSNNNSTWACFGAVGIGTPFETLLTTLEAMYPESGWDSSLLSALLASGMKTALYKQNPVGTYYLNANMVNLNYTNNMYQSVSSAICPLKPLTSSSCNGCANRANYA